MEGGIVEGGLAGKGGLREGAVEGGLAGEGGPTGTCGLAEEDGLAGEDGQEGGLGGVGGCGGGLAWWVA